MYPNSLGSKWELLPESRSGEALFNGGGFSTKEARILIRHEITPDDRRFLHKKNRYTTSSDFFEVMEIIQKQAEKEPLFPIQRIRDQFGNILVIIDGVFKELKESYSMNNTLHLKGRSCTTALPHEVETVIERVEKEGGKIVTDQIPFNSPIRSVE